MNLTTKEVAAILRCSPEKVLGIRAAGKLVGMRCGRDWLFSRDAVEEYLRSITVHPEPKRKPVQRYVPRHIVR